MDDIQCSYLHTEKLSVRFLNQIVISGDCLLSSYFSIEYLGEDSLITLRMCWMVTLHAWDKDLLYYWTALQKDKS